LAPAAKPKRIDPARLPLLRAGAQLLNRPSSAARDPAEIVRLTGGIQAQDPHPARLGLRARSRTLSGADVDRARAEERSLLRSWVMRGTLHLIATEDAGWILPLFAERELSWSRRRIAERLGLDALGQERAMKLVERMLIEANGPLPKTELAERLASKGISKDEAVAGFHVPRLAVLQGIACMGPEQGTRTTYVLAREWIGEQPRFDRDHALAELSRRYLSGFAPAGERDFSAWSGLPLRDCRRGMELIARELEEVRVGQEPCWVLRAARPRAVRRPLVRMLPAFDNHLMGHGHRDIAVPAEYVKRVWPGAGIVRATVLADGIAVATWTARRAGGRITIALDPFAPLDAATQAAVDREVKDIGRFEGLEATLT
jgi:hypothetical protein